MQPLALAVAAATALWLTMRSWYTGVHFPIERPRITQEFGAITPPWYSSANPHRGVDMSPWAGAHGARIEAPLSGKVIDTGEHTYAGTYVILQASVPYKFGASDRYGNYHEVPANAKLFFRLTHFQELRVSKGQRVRKAQLLGLLGNTGKYSSGPHLHLELWAHEYGGNGLLLDPMHFFVSFIVGLKQQIEVV